MMPHAVTLWPVWAAYRKLWRYAGLVPLVGRVPRPRTLPEEPPATLLTVVNAADHCVSAALVAAPLELPNDLYRTYLFLFAQLHRVSYTSSPYFDEATQRWRNLQWRSLAVLVRHPLGAQHYWHRWIEQHPDRREATLQLRYPLVPEPGELDAATAVQQAPALRAVLTDPRAQEHLLTTLRATHPAGGWHPWLTLATPACYHQTRLLPGLNRTLRSCMADPERWHTFVATLPHLTVDLPPQALRATLLRNMDDLARTWAGADRAQWRRRRRLLLPALRDVPRRPHYDQEEEHP